jgi:hypothetical protein
MRPTRRATALSFDGSGALNFCICSAFELRENGATQQLFTVAIPNWNVTALAATSRRLQSNNGFEQSGPVARSTFQLSLSSSRSMKCKPNRLRRSDF